MQALQQGDTTVFLPARRCRETASRAFTDPASIRPQRRHGREGQLPQISEDLSQVHQSVRLLL